VVITPRDDFDFNSSFAAVPNIEELKNLETLNLSCTGITGTVDFDHHPCDDYRLLIFVVYFRHRWNWWMCQSERIQPHGLRIIGRFVQWSSPHDDC
jgi:hypothetical protein